MELRAAIEGIKSLENQYARFFKCDITVITDSQYLLRGITDWINNWKKNRWRGSSGRPVVNKDLWLELDQLCADRDISWKWVPGHSGYKFNEIADKLAKKAAQEGMDYVDK
jgi:ribonuclease HI